ncbi:hypothetical protein QLX08_006249 [Tetragonisca angustula]|uniref:Uncharacterized protein n=1 Tax=Tetragonisca angustula TaxID=166442 RepID=A0AAW0ZV02_9HYME
MNNATPVELSMVLETMSGLKVRSPVLPLRFAGREPFKFPDLSFRLQFCVPGEMARRQARPAIIKVRQRENCHFVLKAWSATSRATNSHRQAL